MILAGEVLGVEQRSGGNGETAFSYVNVHVLEGIKVHQARIGRDFGPNTPRAGERLVAEVEVSAFQRRNGGAGIQVTLVRRVDESVIRSLADDVETAPAAA